jgi:hypothetical protein
MRVAGLGRLAAYGGDRTPPDSGAGAPASPASALAEKVAQYLGRLTADGANCPTASAECSHS